eukprot:188056_1
MDLMCKQSGHNAEAKTNKLDWSCLEYPMFVEGIEPLPTRGPTHHHHHDAHDQMCPMVRNELCIQQYAKIDILQQSAAQTQCHRLMSMVASRVDDSVCDDIVNLLCTFYPVFYWNPHYISLQSNSNIFILHKECCKLSELLCAYIEKDDVIRASPLVIEDIDSDILECVIKYLVNMHCEEVNTMKQSAAECSAHCRWNPFSFIESLDNKTVFEVHEAAKKMKCRSLVELARDRLVELGELSPPRMNEKELVLAQSIERTLDCRSYRFNIRITCTNRIDIV